MTESSNFVERIFLGKAHPISYFFSGIFGSGVVGYLTLVFYNLLGQFAANHYQEISPVFVMCAGVVLLVSFGLFFSGWLWFGCWRHFNGSVHWSRTVIIGLAAIHAAITLFLVFGFIKFTGTTITYLVTDGLWILGM